MFSVIEKGFKTTFDEECVFYLRRLKKKASDEFLLDL